MSLADLARALLDEPRWVEARFMLLRDEAIVHGLAGDRRRFVARSTRWPLIVVVGRPEPPFIAGAAEEADDEVEILAAEEDAGWVAPALAGWGQVGATVHAWPAGVPLPEPPPEHEARLLPPAAIEALRHLSGTYREELLTAASYAPVAAAFTGNAPVSFCYATAVTETLWDVSVDTLESFRHRGLGRKAVRCLMAAMAAQHKWPVWGASDDDPGAIGAARALGFEPAGRLAVFRRPA